MIQWPDDFDFNTIRNMNAPSPTTVIDESTSSPEFEKEKNGGSGEGLSKDRTSTEEQEVVDEGEAVGGGDTTNDLDPEALQKAFVFAAQASIVLVRGLSRFFFSR
jgi:hypothetical protein